MVPGIRSLLPCIDFPSPPQNGCPRIETALRNEVRDPPSLGCGGAGPPLRRSDCGQADPVVCPTNWKIFLPFLFITAIDSPASLGSFGGHQLSTLDDFCLRDAAAEKRALVVS